jgi:putative sterol carrier protein
MNTRRSQGIEGGAAGTPLRDPTSEFFTGLAQRGREPMLQRTSGTLRFDLAGGREVEHWYVSIRKGALTVTHDEDAADCVVRVDKELFDRLASGTANAMAAALRGVVEPSGDLQLIVQFQRLFPGPPQGCDEREEAGYARRGS